jgi:hypothetical protein
VELAEAGEGGGDKGLRDGRIAEVCGEEEGAGAGGINIGSEGAEVGLVAGGEGEAHAFGSKAAGDGFADAAGGAGDESDFVFEIEVHEDSGGTTGISRGWTGWTRICVRF